MHYSGFVSQHVPNREIVYRQRGNEAIVMFYFFFCLLCRRRLLAEHKEGFSLPFDTYRMHVSDHEIPQSQIPSQLHGHFLSGPLSDSNCSCRVFVLLITGNDSYRDRRCVAKDPWNYANIHRLPVLLAYKCRLHYFNR